MAMHLDESLVAEYAERRFGYGSFDAPVWFVGMEEGGGGSLDEVCLRLDTWARLGSQPLDDLREYHLALDHPTHFIEPIKLENTWKGLMRLLAGLRREEPTNEELRQYQAYRLGRHAGETCLIELLPLPSPGMKVWYYKEWTELPQLRSRRAYQAYYAPRRVRAIRQLIAQRRQSLVCFYGLTHLPWWRELVGVKFDEIVLPRNKRGYTGEDGGIVYLLVEHPVAFGVTSSYFAGAGEAAARLIAPDGAHS
ncbi:MAG: hypothetical protein M3O34_05055 [Chloroflexota bacterium]|nr:hypothetical protein [Chloroflexota bacterium]